MNRHAAILLAGILSALLPDVATAQAKRYDLTSTKGLGLHNATAESATFKGKKGLRVSLDPAAARRPELAAGQEAEVQARIAGLEFTNGVIEAEIAGSLAPDAGAGARGFVGIAFRVDATRAADAPQAYDAFYLRPTNGRADDQERRNHAVQYISHPDWTWSRLRKETPSRYESYADIVPDTWTKVRVEVRGAQAKLFVNDQPQPVLIVNDVKSGAEGKGAVALWVGPGTVAYFRNLVVTP